MQVHVMASKHLVFPQARGCKSAPSAMVSVRSVLLGFRFLFRVVIPIT